MEAKDTYTQGHSRRVEMLSVRIAQQLSLHPRKVEAIRVASLLHDIGKIGIDDSILRKPGFLTPEERLVIETHPVIATRILTEVDLPDNIDNIILHHHEFYNGTGYPGRITVPDVPLEAFILGVADAYDAMTSDRPYRKGMSPQKAQSILREESGKQFHPEVVKAFLEMMAMNPPPSEALAPESSASISNTGG
jgi:putative nucleotidyltransferase with HDIG domain